MILFSLYIIDDEETIREGLTMALEENYNIRSFINAETAIEALQSDPPDLILLDIGLPGMSGIDALNEINRLNPEILTIMISAYEDIDTVISAMKLGAYDYVVKPIQMDGLKVTISNALESIRLRKEVLTLQKKYLKENLPCFIGESDTIQDMMVFLDKVAKSPSTPILITGETGTGKELIASSIHHRSPNFKGNFITVNCAAIPKDLIESEIFGYAKGAFSGAAATGKKGLVEDAVNGTLFLDEIGDLSLEAQAKLLRFLENGEFYKIGSTKKEQIKTRVVSATNKNLEKMIEKELFRKDLYFRLGVIKIEVPSLNERRNDILLLANSFLSEYSQKFNKTFTSISSRAKEALMLHNWTGNVRELKNFIERGVLIGDGPELMPLDMGFKNSEDTLEQDSNKMVFSPVTSEGIDLSQILQLLEKYYIDGAFEIAKGNESKAAKLLSINHHTYRYKRKKCRELSKKNIKKIR